jgi:hypothetical protein
MVANLTFSQNSKKDRIDALRGRDNSVLPKMALRTYKKFSISLRNCHIMLGRILNIACIISYGITFSAQLHEFSKRC